MTVPVTADTSAFEWYFNETLKRAERNLVATLSDPGGTGSSVGGRLNGSLRGGAYTGGLVANVMGFASGGLIPGTPPANHRQDNLLAKVDGGGMIKVRSREFIQPQEAVDHYGMDFMNAIRTLSLPKFSQGGSTVGHSSGGGSQSSGPALVELTAANIAAIQRAGDRPVSLYADSTVLAQSVNHGNTILASTGAN